MLSHLRTPVALLFCFILLGQTMTGWAADQALPRHAVPTSVIDGDTFTIPHVGRIRLMGIDTPELEHERLPAEPYAQQAKHRATELLMRGGQSVKLSFAPQGRSRDVYARPLCYVELANGQDLAEQLLEEGLAIVYPSADLNRYKRYSKAERRARKAKRGAWLEGHWLVDHTEARHHVGAYRIVGGTILNVDQKGGWIYLNFGKNWREDFTVTISHRDWLAHFRKVLGPFKELQGRFVEVRGRIGWRNGASIRAYHPYQLQLDQ
ncbi:nuclease (SNase domain protein) [Magnetococcus marinus MC-1]|uniref:Nuclease (SNase domain protein) n=1 Tax=Magnetococcus marinus (strain ATCC BAA-1437 / JCM 17883 / MC-1) TaxID=156889 RepID=A0LD70_MAGMM|nr:thermonuclease family protein [Magnetococcus marinus]ABK45913.1 nuclease (SNase domain protein) [Magnetococcus marinus MC-1]